MYQMIAFIVYFLIGIIVSYKETKKYCREVELHTQNEPICIFLFCVFIWPIIFIMSTALKLNEKLKKK